MTTRQNTIAPPFCDEQVIAAIEAEAEQRLNTARQTMAVDLAFILKTEAKATRRVAHYLRTGEWQ